MDPLSRFFVQQPLHALGVAVLLLALWAWLRRGGREQARRARGLPWAAGAWLAYAAWEWAVLAFSPGADIRVDLLLIGPLLALPSLWSVARLFRT